MRLSTFFKVSGAVLVVAVLALGGVYSGIQAGPLAQATSDASMAATAASGVASMAATAASGSAATMAATGVTYPLCPPATMSASEVATMSASEVATMSASMAATMPAAATLAGTMNVANPGYIGVRVQLVDSCGLMVVEVLPDSPALTAGIQVGDVIVAAGGTPITSLDDMRNVTNQYSAGQKLTLTIQRNGAQMDIVVTLGLRPTVLPGTLAATAASTTSASTASSSTGASAATTSATMAATQ